MSSARASENAEGPLKSNPLVFKVDLSPFKVRFIGQSFSKSAHHRRIWNKERLRPWTGRGDCWAGGGREKGASVVAIS